MVDSGLVIWNSAIELCGYNHQIDGAQASNALNWLYTYRNGVAHCGVNHARYCLQVLEGDKETEKIVQIILVYMFILINTYVEAYSAEEQEDYAVCFAELVEKGITTVEALNIFVEGDERIRKVADALPDIYRESDPAVRRQQAIDYLKRMEER